MHVLQKKAQDLAASDITSHFSGEKVDLVFASHFLYCLLGDMHKASLDPSIPLREHPLWKYFDMLRDDGVFVVTLQSGAGARLFRNALLGDHGLTPSPSSVEDETVSLLKSFGNMAQALRYLEVFTARYKIETGKTLSIKMRYAVANVPLGSFTVDDDFRLHNPHGSDDNPDFLAPKMFDFYGNWKELTTKGTTTARKTQALFLHILRAFAPAAVCMQHPNITLEITLLSTNN